MRYWGPTKNKSLVYVFGTRNGRNKPFVVRLTDCSTIFCLELSLAHCLKWFLSCGKSAILIQDNVVAYDGGLVQTMALVV